MSHDSRISVVRLRKPRHFAGRYPARRGGFTLVADIPRISEPEENLLHCGEIIEGRYRAVVRVALYSAVRADRRGAACSMAGGVMDDRSRTVFHTINNRYRRPVVNPELSSRGAGTTGDERPCAVIERPGSNWRPSARARAAPCLRVLGVLGVRARGFLDPDCLTLAFSSEERVRSRNSASLNRRDSS